MTNKSITIRLPDEVLGDLDTLAKATARNRNYFITEAVKELVACEMWHLHRIQEGMHQAEAGQFVPDDEMEAFWASWTTPEALAEARASVATEMATRATS